MFSYEARDYLQEQTIAEIVKNALSIYWRYFWKFFLSYSLLISLSTVLGFVGYALLGDSPFTGILVYFAVWFVGSCVASLIVTIVVSDICLGELPSLKRAWKHLSFRLVVKTLITNLLFYVIFVVFILLGSVLMGLLLQSRLPGWGYYVYAGLMILVFFALISWFLFVPTILVVENKWGFRAMKRSVTLGFGYHVRNFVIVFMMFVLVTLLPVILYIISMVIGSEDWGPFLGIGLYYIIGFLIQPLGLIYVVLLYYDIRVRKEGYDASALTQDLRH
jgi:hypothetical protein